MNKIKRFTTYLRAVYGDSEAQYLTAQMISDSALPDAKKSALKWYEIAANQGHPQACYDYAVYLIKNFNDNDKAIEYLKKSNANITSDAAALLGQLLISKYDNILHHRKLSQSVNKEQSRKTRKSRQSAVDKYIHSLQLNSQPIDIKKLDVTDQELELYLSDALTYIKIAQEKNHPLGFHTYACYLLEYTPNGDADYVDALNLLDKAVELKFAPSCQVLAGIYENGIYGVKQDIQRGLELRVAAANFGSTQAQFVLGVLVYQGQGFEKNKEQGLKLIKKAADSDHLEAKEFLAKLDKETLVTLLND